MVVERDWYYSSSEGEVCINVTGLSEEEIRLVNKAVRAEFELAGGVEILIHRFEDQVLEWHIYKAVKLP